MRLPDREDRSGSLAAFTTSVFFSLLSGAVLPSHRWSRCEGLGGRSVSKTLADFRWLVIGIIHEQVVR